MNKDAEAAATGVDLKDAAEPELGELPEGTVPDGMQPPAPSAVPAGAHAAAAPPTTTAGESSHAMDTH
jgi:hypothetical protein